MVLDFANEADEIKAAFEPYYETTLALRGDRPESALRDPERGSRASRSTPRPTSKPSPRSTSTRRRRRISSTPCSRRWSSASRTISREEQHDFRGQLTDYVRLYAFLSQVLTFADADLEKLYVFARHLRRLLPADRARAAA